MVLAGPMGLSALVGLVSAFGLVGLVIIVGLVGVLGLVYGRHDNVANRCRLQEDMIHAAKKNFTF